MKIFLLWCFALILSVAGAQAGAIRAAARVTKTAAVYCRVDQGAKGVAKSPRLAARAAKFALSKFHRALW